jgi:hypothetical protein
MGLRKINTIGVQQANKVMHRAAIAYNLKKYLKFTQKRARSEAKVLGVIFLEITLYIKFFWSCVSPPKKQNSTLFF